MKAKIPLIAAGRNSELVNINEILCRVFDSSWNVMAHGDTPEGKWRGNWRMEWVASTLHTCLQLREKVDTNKVGISALTFKFNIIRVFSLKNVLTFFY
jgi:hypothetical protein